MDDARYLPHTHIPLLPPVDSMDISLLRVGLRDIRYHMPFYSDGWLLDYVTVTFARHAFTHVYVPICWFDFAVTTLVDLVYTRPPTLPTRLRTFTGWTFTLLTLFQLLVPTTFVTTVRLVVPSRFLPVALLHIPHVTTPRPYGSFNDNAAVPFHHHRTRLYIVGGFLLLPLQHSAFDSRTLPTTYTCPIYHPHYGLLTRLTSHAY